MSIPGNANPLLLASAAADAAAAGPIKSLRFNSGDSAYLNRTPSSAGNQTTWTWSCWAKTSDTSGNTLFGEDGGYPNAFTWFDNNATLRFSAADASSALIFDLRTTALFRDHSSWYHVVCVYDSSNSTEGDRARIYVNGTRITDFGTESYPSQNATTCVNASSNPFHIGVHSGVYYLNGYLADVYFIDGSALDPTSFGAFDDNGVWQAAAYSGTFGTNGFHLLDFANESTVGHDSSGNENDFTANNISTSAGAGNDVLFDVPTNGTQSDTGAGGEVSGNYPTVNPLVSANIGSTAQGNLQVTTQSSNYGPVVSTMATSGSGKWYAEIKWDSGTHAEFGLCRADSTIVGQGHLHELTNSYVLDKYAGQIRYNGGSNGSASVSSGDLVGIAFDESAGTVQFFVNGSSVGTLDSSGATAGVPYLFAIADRDSATAGTFTFNFGQRSFTNSAPSGYKALNTASLPTPTIADGSAQFQAILWSGTGSSRSITTTGMGPDFVWYKQRNSSTYGHDLFDSVRGPNNVLNSNNTLAEYTEANRLTAFNADGFSLGNSAPTNGSSGTYVGWAWNAGANSNKTYTVTVVSDSGNKYRFDGHGTSAVTLDLAEGSTYVFDQSDSSNSGHPLRFSTTSDGTHNSGSEYTTGVTTTGTPGSAGAKTTIVVAASAPTLYYYCSSHSGMGGQANTNDTAGASNFDGSIQSTVKANPEAGFSIVTYSAGNQAVTVGHGLNAAPELIIAKSRNANLGWKIYHSALGVGGFLEFDSDAFYSFSNYWGSSITSSTFGVSAGGDIALDNMLAYCFAPVAGYSHFTTFEGTGSSDPVFVYCGFRPRWILRKNADAAKNWYLHDTDRDTFNICTKEFQPHNTSSEGNHDAMDILSNGFAIRTSNAQHNNSGSTHIVAAFAENPFQANGGLAR